MEAGNSCSDVLMMDCGHHSGDWGNDEKQSNSGHTFWDLLVDGRTEGGQSFSQLCMSVCLHRGAESRL